LLKVCHCVLVPPLSNCCQPSCQFSPQGLVQVFSGRGSLKNIGQRLGPIIVKHSGRGKRWQNIAHARTWKSWSGCPPWPTSAPASLCFLRKTPCWLAKAATARFEKTSKKAIVLRPFLFTFDFSVFVIFCQLSNKKEGGKVARFNQSCLITCGQTTQSERNAAPSR